MLTLLAMLALGQLDDSTQVRVPHADAMRVKRAGGRPGSVTAVAPAFATLEFAPITGNGMTAACACSALSSVTTGGGTSAISFARASVDSCFTGATQSGINNSSNVSCASGQPVAQPGAFSGGAVIGLAVDGAATNLVLFPNTFNNVNWATTQNVGAYTTVSTNNPAPDGTNTASRVQFPATTGAQFSLARQTLAYSTPISGSVYAKAVSGTADLCVFVGDGVGAVRYSNISSTSWTLLKHENSPRPGGGFFVGTDSADCATGPFAAQDVYLWRAWAVTASNNIGIPVDTTRVATVASQTVTLSGSFFSAAASWQAPGAFANNATAFQIFKDATNNITAFSTSTGALSCAIQIAGVTTTTTSLALILPNVENRVACYYDGTNAGSCVNGVCTLTTGALTLFTGVSTFYFGTRSATGNEANSTLSKWCYDPSATKCSREQTGFTSIAGFGDSITAAPSGPGTGWPDRTSVWGSPSVVTNWGLNGALTTDVYTTRWLISGKGRYKDNVVLAGINDLRTTADTPALILTHLQQTYTEILAEGGRLYVVTVLPWSNFAGWTSGRQTDTETLNASIRSYCAATPKCYLVDAYNSALRSGTALAAIYDSGDGLHPNAAGSDVLAALIKNAIAP